MENSKVFDKNKYPPVSPLLPINGTCQGFDE